MRGEEGFMAAGRRGSKQTRQSFGLQMAVYLLGLAIGGLYVGMVSPVRTVIQQDFGIDSETGIWMIEGRPFR